MSAVVVVSSGFSMFCMLACSIMQLFRLHLAIQTYFVPSNTPILLCNDTFFVVVVRLFIRFGVPMCVLPFFYTIFFGFGVISCFSYFTLLEIHLIRNASVDFCNWKLMSYSIIEFAVNHRRHKQSTPTLLLLPLSLFGFEYCMRFSAWNSISIQQKKSKYLPFFAPTSSWRWWSIFDYSSSSFFLTWYVLYSLNASAIWPNQITLILWTIRWTRWHARSGSRHYIVDSLFLRKMVRFFLPSIRYVIACVRLSFLIRSIS